MTDPIKQENKRSITRQCRRKQHRHKRMDIHNDAEFLGEFTDQRSFRRFARVDLAARKFPQPCHGLASRTLLDQPCALCVPEPRRCDNHDHRLIAPSEVLKTFPLKSIGPLQGTRDRGNDMLSILRKLLRNSRGATLIEYALIIALMVIAMMVALRGVAVSTTNMWNNVSDTVNKN